MRTSSTGSGGGTRRGGVRPGNEDAKSYRVFDSVPFTPSQGVISSHQPPVPSSGRAVGGNPQQQQHGGSNMAAYSPFAGGLSTAATMGESPVSVWVGTLGLALCEHLWDYRESGKVLSLLLTMHVPITHNYRCHLYAQESSACHPRSTCGACAHTTTHIGFLSAVPSLFTHAFLAFSAYIDPIPPSPLWRQLPILPTEQRQRRPDRVRLCSRISPRVRHGSSGRRLPGGGCPG